MTTAYDSGTPPQIQVCHRLRIAREEAGLEQGELAALIGVSRNTIGNAEKRGSQPRAILLNAWAMACGVPVTWIKTGTYENPRPDGDPDGGVRTVRPQGLEPRTQ